MKNATLRQLRVFEAAARHLSVTRAAEELHLTPPAVSISLLIGTSRSWSSFQETKLPSVRRIPEADPCALM